MTTLAQSSKSTQPQNVLLGGVTSVAQSAWILFTASPEAIKKSAKWRAEAAVAVARITGGYSKDVAADWRDVEAKLNEAYGAVK